MRPERFIVSVAVCLAAFLMIATSRPALAQPVVPDGFEDAHVAFVANPTALAVTPDGRILIASQLGQLHVYQHGALLDYTDFGSDVCAYRERGLVGLAVDPDFAFNHFVYLSYSFNKFGDCDAEGSTAPVGRVSRFRLNDDNTLDRATERVLIDNIPSQIGIHNLDDVEFGNDGYLYVSVGDGGCDYAGDSGCAESNDAARDMHALVGKVLRITRDGDIPPDNPYAGPDTVRCSATGGALPGLTCQEIFATGLRNPWRLAFDPNATGTRFFINDVGQDTWEEINEGFAGADYGWNAREAFCAAGSATECSPAALPGLTNPVFAYDRSDGCGSITGGAFVPNGTWPADLDGVYLFSDYVCGAIFRLVPAGDGAFTRETFVSGLGDSSATDLYFGPHNSGLALYYLNYANGGEVRRITYVGTANRKPTALLTAAPLSGAPPLVVDFEGSASTDPDGDELMYEWDFGDGTPVASGQSVRHIYPEAGTYTATLRVSDPAGSGSSATTRIDVGNTPPEPAILMPGADHRFAVGDTIVLQGRAADVEDGELPESSLTWRVVLHHNTHTHGFLPPTSGNNVVFRAPGPENLEAAATSYLEVQLTASDSNGRATTVSQTLMPRTAHVQILAEPPGATVRVDNALVTTPASFVSWVNYPVAVGAESQVGSDGAPLVFASWSDGGAATHTIETPVTSSAYTAHFTRQATSSGESAPFSGTPVALPGTIQAEDFDNGGQDVAYRDLSPGNEGGEYRFDTDVDIAAAHDAGGGYTLGWVGAGEWLNYTATIGSPGTYEIEVRVASAGTGGTFHIEVDGVDKTGSLTVPNTGDWQAWITLRITGVTLSAGQQVWRLVMDANGATTGAVGNFNWIRATEASGGGGAGSTPFTGTPVALPGTIQAENFDNGGQDVAYRDLSSGNEGGVYRFDTHVDIAPAHDAGGGYTLGWVGAGEWLNYTVTLGSPGTYEIEVRVASAGTGGTFHIEVDGVDKTGPLTIPNTEDWQAWITLRITGLTLSAGQQVWRLVMDANGTTTGAVGNFNWIRATAASGGGGAGSTPFTGTPVALPGAIQAEDFDNGNPGVAYHDNSPGNKGGEYRFDTDADLAAAVDAGGGYTLGWVSAGEWLNYTVNVGSAGTYTIDVRVASAGAGGTFHIEVDGVDRTGPLTVPNTGVWQAWITLRTSGVSLSAGQQVWRLVMDANGATTGAVGNFNWMHVSSAAGVVEGPERGPYLQQVTESSAIVVWTTREPSTAAVRYATNGGAVVTTTAETRPFSAAQTGLPNDFYQHEARLSGLVPASRYTYDVLVGGADATPGHYAFTTAPSTGGGAVRFIAFGDSGVGSSAQRQLAQLMEADSFDLAIHAGDIAYGTSDGLGGGSYAQLDEWVFTIYAPWLRSRALFPAIGNHDDEVEAARPYRDVFVLPENGANAIYPDHAERYYSFDYGAIHFVALDTELAFQDPARRDAQVAWLDADLAATTQPWRIVYLHRPPYSAGPHHGSDLEVRRAFVPLFEKHNVQLVVAAHEHQYERSVPWREFLPGDNGVVYLVTGGGGGPLHPSGFGPWTATSASVHHYVRMSVEHCTLSGEAVSIDGSVLDVFAINGCESVPPDTGGDVDLYATDVDTMGATWERLPSFSGATHVKMSSTGTGVAARRGRSRPAVSRRRFDTLSRKLLLPTQPGQ